MAEQIYAEVSGSTSKVVTSLSTLETKLTGLNEKFTTAAGSAGLFASAIGSIKTSTQSANLSSLSKSISAIASASKRLKDQAPGLVASLQQVGTAVNSMPMMNHLNVDALKSFSDALKPLGSSIKRLAANAGLLHDALQKIATAMNNMPPLSPQATKTLSLLAQVAPLAMAGTKGVTTLSKAATNLGKASGVASNGLFRMISMAKRYVVTGIMIRLITGFSHAVSNAMSNSAEWIEDMNYFNVAYGEMAEKAGAYYTEISDSLGIDMSVLIKNGAMFEAMAKSLGLAADGAYALSTNLVAIGIDLASLTGKDLQDTWDALQSGVIAGQYKPLAKNYGINVTQSALEQTVLKENASIKQAKEALIDYTNNGLADATIAQTALNEGITESVRTMSPLEKAYLRYKTVVNAAKIAQGDMAKTLESPANMTRVFQSAVMGLSRAIGNFMMPILIRVIPYVIAFTKVLATAFNALAGIMGFEQVSFGDPNSVIPDFSEAFDDIEHGAGDANDKVTELKKNIMGFDQFNILTENSQGGSGGGEAFGGGSSFPMDWGEWDLMFDQLTGTKVDEAFTEIQEALEPLASAFSNLFDELEDLMPELKEFYEKQLKPIGSWFVGEGLPGLVGVLKNIVKFFNEHPELLDDLARMGVALSLIKQFGVIPIVIAFSISVAEWLTGKSFTESAEAVIGAIVQDWNDAINEYDFSKAQTPLDFVNEAIRAFATNAATVVVDITKFFQWSGDPLSVYFSFGNDSPIGQLNLWKAKLLLEFELIGKNFQIAITDYWLNPMIAGLNAMAAQWDIFLVAMGLKPLNIKLDKIDTTTLHNDIILIDAELDLLESYSKNTATKFKDNTEKGVNDSVKVYGGMPYSVSVKMDEYAKTVNQKSTTAATKFKDNTAKGVNGAVQSYGGMPYSVAAKMDEYSKTVNQKSTTAGKALETKTKQYTGSTVNQYQSLKTGATEKLNGYLSIVSQKAKTSGQTLRDTTATYKNSTINQYQSLKTGADEKLSGYAKNVETRATSAGNSLANTTSIYRGHTVAQYGQLDSEVQGKMSTFKDNLSTSVTLAMNTLRGGTKAGTDDATAFTGKYSEEVSEYMAYVANHTGASMQEVYDRMGKMPESVKKWLGISWNSYERPKDISFRGSYGHTGQASYATGGFPEDGLFLANHSELVGKFSNGRTAVANNIQILEGIRSAVSSGLAPTIKAISVGGSGVTYETVYRAVRDALKEATITTGDTYLDGEKVATSVVKRINTSARRTGVTPIKVGS